MTREWFSSRLPRPAWSEQQEYPAQAILDVVPALVRHLRTADPEGRWHFWRHPEPPGEVLDVWFHTTPAVGDELAYRLHVQVTRHGWSADPVWNRASAPASGAHRTTGLLADLSVLSCDFALDLLGDGDLDSAAQLDAATRHLRFLSGLMPPADRPAFLFLCWQHWSRELTADQRVERGRQADQLAMELLHRAAGTAPWQQRWDRYFDEFCAVLQGDSGDPDQPVKYVLFDHAHLTHNRLGIAADTEALAARAVRTALRSGGTGQ
jgi:hypothetical protein